MYALLRIVNDIITTQTGPTTVGPNSSSNGKGDGNWNAKVGALGGWSQPNQPRGGDTAPTAGGVEREGWMKGLIVLSLAFVFGAVAFLVALNVWGVA